MEKVTPLNRRKDDRYCIEELPIPGTGSMVEVSRNGLKIKKNPGLMVDKPIINFRVGNLEIIGNLRWEDVHWIGLGLAAPLGDPALFLKRTKRVKETIPPPQMKISPDKAVIDYKKDEALSSMINLLMEVESPDPDIRKIGLFIEAICASKETADQTGEEGKEKKDELVSCRDELIARAAGLRANEGTEIKDINFAITILGLDNVRKTILDHVHKMMFQSETSLAIFENYQTFNILKSVLFKNLCFVFGLKDLQPEGTTLFSFETAGIEILIKESSGILDQYYRSQSRIYSEISRMYEKAFFGADPLQINKHFFEKAQGSIKDFYQGYVLAHCTLNPQYTPAEDLKISLTKNGLIFAYMAYLTFLAVGFLLERDKECGFILKKRLMGKGMDRGKLYAFFEKTVNDTKTLMREFSIQGSISLPPFLEDLETPEKTLGDDIRFDYLFHSLREFGHQKVKRLALRYDDGSYAHFLLGKLLNLESIALNSKTLCVFPCRNTSVDQWYINDFNYFDLLVFKDITKLPASHHSALIKLWNSFEGQIIVTFSQADFLDYTNPPLYGILNKSVVDFPSYFYSDSIYQKMIAQTVSLLKPYIGNQEVTISKYLKEIYSMNHIKADILLTKEIE